MCRSLICATLLSLGFAFVHPWTVVAGDLTVEGQFEIDDEPNLSGMDCMAKGSATSRPCLLVDDELKAAQFATLKPGVLTVGDVVNLFSNANPPIVGRRPEQLAPVRCSKGEDPGEMDGEGVAFAEPYFYVVGSHGCSKKGKYRPETFVLARVKVSEAGEVESVERTYRLSEALLASLGIKDFFALDLTEELTGISIEGIAANGDELIFGLRSPAKDKKAFLLSVSADALFAPGEQPLAVQPAPLQTIPVEEHSGLRDIELLPDGRLLALTGPSLEAPGTYALQVFGPDRQPQGDPVTVPATEIASPEAIEWLGDGENGRPRVLVISDGVEADAAIIVKL